MKLEKEIKIYLKILLLASWREIQRIYIFKSRFCSYKTFLLLVLKIRRLKYIERK